MAMELPLNQTSIPTDDGGRCATGQLATDAKLDAIIAALKAGGIVFDPDIDIGDVHLLNVKGDKQNPAVAVADQATYTGGEPINPVAAITKTTRAGLAADGKWGAPQLTANGDLRTKDDDLNTAMGTTTSAVVADNTTAAASATAADGIGLWKRIVNLLIAVLAKLPALGTAGAASANVISVQGIASGTTLPVTEASAADILTAIGKLSPAKGVIVPQADLTADAGAGVYEDGIAIPANVVAVNVFASEAVYVVVNATEADPALTGAVKPPDTLISLSCIGCTWLHVAQVAAASVLKYEYVYGV